MTRTGRPRPSSEDVARRMRVTGRRDTSAELALRRELYRRGLRYRVDVRPSPKLRTRADVVFSRERVAVFVDGCFWHGCPRHATWPKANAEWWRDKIEANRARDHRVVEGLEALDWIALRIWEHEDPVLAAEKIERVVKRRRERAPRRPSS